MSQSRRLTLSLGLALCCLAPLPGNAADPQAKPTPPPPDEPPPTLVVLTTGQVFSGPMTQRPEGYMVQVHNGEVLVPYAMVQAAATSLPAAYVKMRDNFTTPTANDRLELARWCLTQDLVEEARQEALSALRLEPERREARLLLQQLELRRAPTPAAAPVDAPAGAETSVAPRPITGLSRESLATFVRQVQPLLGNRCGNARCHGAASENRLKLEPVSATRINRYQNDKNLSVVLGFVDAARPDQSRLLLRAFEDQGPHRGLFSGPKSAEQKALLSNWVAEVAPLSALRTIPSRSDRSPAPVAPASVAGSDGYSHAPDATQPAVAQRTEAHEHLLTTPLPTARTPPPTGNHVDEAFLRRILDEERPDAFDPDEFNRLVHGVETKSAPKTP